MTTSNLIASSITAILAMDESRLIGTNGGLPWHIPEDLKRFKELTMGHTVVMGHNTYFSLPERFRPLPGRHNIVITKDTIPGVETFTSPEDFIKNLEVGNVGKVGNGEKLVPAKAGIGKIFLMGGARMYNTFFKNGWVDEVELTLVDGVHDGDVYVADFRDDFLLQKSQPFSGEEFRGEFQTWVRENGAG